MDWSLRFRVRQSLKGNLWMLPLLGVIAGGQGIGGPAAAVAPDAPRTVSSPRTDDVAPVRSQ